MTAPLLELVDVAKRFRRGDVVIDALQGVTFSIERGEFVAIVGASGSGKTTLMNILGCLDRPTAGRYRVRGEDVADLAPAEVARLRRDLFGFVFQTYNLIGSATVIENVEVPAIYAGAKPAERRARAAALLDRLGLAERADHRPSQLSGGQQQRVAIARALMNGGEVIFADEPSGALDSRSGDEVMALLKRLNAEGHTVVLITHNAEVAAAASRIVEIKDGRFVRDTGPRRGPAAAPPPVPVRGRRLLPAFAGEFVESLRRAARSLRAHVFRTVLTLLGIVIGVASVVAMLAVGNGAKQSVLERISWMGSNLLLVRPGGPQSRGGQVATLVPEDAEAIRALPNVLAAVAEVNGPVTLRYRNVDYQTQATAVTADLPLARAWPVRHGLFFDEDDLKRYAPVAVLGETALVNLFGPDEDPVGRYVLVNNVPFLVIGVMAPKGATPWGADMDDTIFVPLTTGSLRLFGQRHLRTITVLVDELARIDATEQAIWRLLIERHRAEDFRIRNMESVVQAATETQNTLTLMLGSIAAISLLVGGIGVMNIMLISVTERTREIGIRVATGARTANILQQFLTEAVAVSALGGAIGAAGRLGVAWLLAALGTPIVITAGLVLLAVGCAFATGVIFGFMPARKAAGLDPVVALGFG